MKEGEKKTQARMPCPLMFLSPIELCAKEKRHGEPKNVEALLSKPGLNSTQRLASLHSIIDLTAVAETNNSR